MNVEELKIGLRLSPIKVNNVEEISYGYTLRLEAILKDEEMGILEYYYDEESLDLILELEADNAKSDTSSEFEYDLDEFNVEESNVEILE